MSSQIPPAHGDRGRRKSVIDRRQFAYDAHIPERRRLPERRILKYRREATSGPPTKRSHRPSTAGTIIQFPVPDTDH